MTVHRRGEGPRGNEQRRGERGGRRQQACAHFQIPATRRTRSESREAVTKPTPRREAKAAAMPSRPAHAASTSAGSGNEHRRRPSHLSRRPRAASVPRRRGADGVGDRACEQARPRRCASPPRARRAARPRRASARRPAAAAGGGACGPRERLRLGLRLRPRLRRRAAPRSARRWARSACSSPAPCSCAWSYASTARRRRRAAASPSLRLRGDGRRIRRRGDGRRARAGCAGRRGQEQREADERRAVNGWAGEGHALEIAKPERSLPPLWGES